MKTFLFCCRAHRMTLKVMALNGIATFSKKLKRRCFNNEFWVAANLYRSGRL